MDAATRPRINIDLLDTHQILAATAYPEGQNDRARLLQHAEELRSRAHATLCDWLLNNVVTVQDVQDHRELFQLLKDTSIRDEWQEILDSEACWSPVVSTAIHNATQA